jgi:hypothetical protein
MNDGSRAGFENSAQRRDSLGVMRWLPYAVCTGCSLLCATSACSNPASTKTSATAGTTTGSGGASAGTGGTSTSSASTSSASTGGASTGTGGAPLTLTITPSKNCATPYAMDFGATHVEVDPTQGARVSVLRVNGADVLASQAVTGDMIDWGSTFWPSPQKWPWPPNSSTSIANVDPNPYSCVASDASSFTLKSAAITSTNANVPNISVTKRFSADLAKEALVIEYTMTNTGTTAVMIAPWEISRVPGGSLAFYPGTMPGTRPGSTFAVPKVTTDPSGIVWYQHNTSDATQYKLFDDGKMGWLAAVVADSLFVKQFDDVPASAQPPTEAEIELYSSAKYVEVEEQGAYQSLAAGASQAWTVRWYARTIPAGVTAAVSSPSLVSLVQSLLK